ncbi:MAG: hypothetical protein HFH41_10785 [Lachnospiraceae bacterium]|nr:hypothetical protein [Lachnospiraceae bacterium]
MMEYRLENYEEALTHQVIHMDQAVCYCPEFRATKMMHHYPSRRLQLARAVYKNEIELSDYIGQINFTGILSRQGERWQNFRECPEDCTDVTILCRQMLLEKGYAAPETEAFQKALQKGGNRLMSAVKWELPFQKDSEMGILLDDETAQCGKKSQENLNAYLKLHKMSFVNEAESEFLGFEYFAYGMVEEGKSRLENLVEKYQNMGIRKLLVLSAKAAYLLREFVKKLDITPEFEVVYLPEILEPVKESVKTYVYGGSFNLRYLGNSAMLNQLVPGETKEQIPASQEFIPLIKGNARVNELTIWQKPIGAEYQLFCPDEKIMEAVREDALADIRKSGSEKILIFEPTACEILKKAFPDQEAVYYLEII